MTDLNKIFAELLGVEPRKYVIGTSDKNYAIEKQIDIKEKTSIDAEIIETSFNNAPYYEVTVNKYPDFTQPENFMKLLELATQYHTRFDIDYLHDYKEYFVFDGGNGTGEKFKTIQECLIQHLIWFLEKPSSKCYHKKQIIKKQEDLKQQLKQYLGICEVQNA